MGDEEDSLQRTLGRIEGKLDSFGAALAAQSVNIKDLYEKQDEIKSKIIKELEKDLQDTKLRVDRLEGFKKLMFSVAGFFGGIAALTVHYLITLYGSK